MKYMTTYLVIALSFASMVSAQVSEASTYRLHFRLHESGPDASETTLNYVLLVQSETLGKINASRRLPYYTRSKDDAKELHTVAVGSIIECTPRESECGPLFACALESSQVAPEQPLQTTPTGFLPVLNSRQVTTEAAITLGEEVQLALLDDPTTGSRLAIFVIAERLAQQ